MSRVYDMIDGSEHSYLGAEFGRRYVDPSTATNARQVGEYIASNATFRQRQDAQEQDARRTATLLEKLGETGCKKMTDKVYIHHTMYPGGQRKQTPEDLMAKDPTKIIMNAVAGMLPKNSLGRDCLKNLFVYVGYFLEI